MQRRIEFLSPHLVARIGGGKQQAQVTAGGAEAGDQPERRNAVRGEIELR